MPSNFLKLSTKNLLEENFTKVSDISNRFRELLEQLDYCSLYSVDIALSGQNDKINYDEQKDLFYAFQIEK